MNKLNLIRLGTFLQREFKIPENYQAFEVPPGIANMVVVDDQESLERYEILLRRVSIKDGPNNEPETIYAGYDQEHRMLVIKDLTPDETRKERLQ